MPDDVLVALPILIPLGTAPVALWARALPALERGLSFLSMLLLLGAALALLVRSDPESLQITVLAGWPAPHGIVLVADRLSSLMLVLTGLLGCAGSLYAFGDVAEARRALGYHPALHVLVAGMSGAFLAGDLFNLYVWFEVMLVASFVLMALGGTREQLEGSIKYVFVNLLASVFFLTGIGLLYGMTGTLNLADLALRLEQVGSPGLTLSASMLLLAAFGIKAAVFPVFSWLPASYPTPPAAIASIFGGLLTKVGVYALLRVFTLLFAPADEYTGTLLRWIAGATMVAGALGAAVQVELRRFLSYLVICAVGFALMGLGLQTRPGVDSSIFFLLEDAIVIANLFLLSGLVEHVYRTSDFRKLGGLYAARPALALLFAVPAFSVAGYPPLSGFWAKLALVRAGFEDGHHAAAAVVLLTSLLVAYAVTRVWRDVFLRPPPRGEPTLEVGPAASILVLPTSLLLAVTLSISLFPGPFYALAASAAEQLLDRADYIEAVLGP